MILTSYPANYISSQSQVFGSKIQVVAKECGDEEV